MKKLRIRAGGKNHEEIKNFVKKVVRIGLGLVMILSFFLYRIFSHFYDIKHADRYDKIIEEFRSPESEDKKFELGWWNEELSKEQIQTNKQLNKDFFSYVKEANGEDLNAKDSKIFCDQTLEDQFSEIDNYLQNEKINIHNLDIYLFKDKNNQERHWEFVRGGKLYLIDFAKALLVNNLTRLVILIQGFTPGKIKTKEFTFYSELFIKVLIFTLLIKFLREERSTLNEESDPQKERTLNGEVLLEISYSLVNFLSLSTSFISILPPSNVLKMGFFKRVILSTCVILLNSFLEEYTEKNAEESGEKKNILIRRSFQFKVLIEVVVFFFLNPFINYYFAENKIYSEKNNFVMKKIRKILLLTNRLVSSIVEVVINWRGKFNEKVSEKAL